MPKRRVKPTTVGVLYCGQAQQWRVAGPSGKVYEFASGVRTEVDLEDAGFFLGGNLGAGHKCEALDVFVPVEPSPVEAPPEPAPTIVTEEPDPLAVLFVDSEPEPSEE